MENAFKFLFVLLTIYMFLLSCQNNITEHVKIEASRVVEIEGKQESRIILTDQAFIRLDIQTTAVKEEKVSTSDLRLMKVVPHSAILYDTDGVEWVYTNPDHLEFIREKVIIHVIEGGYAFLEQGPPSGTVVVTTGASELLGTEFHVGH